MTCNATFLLSGYISPDDDGSGTLYQLTESDSGPLAGVSGGTSPPTCGLGSPAFCDTVSCPSRTTLLRTWKETVTVPVTILGTVHLYLLGRADNPSGNWFQQALTGDFYIERGGVTVFNSGPFDTQNCGFSGSIKDLPSLNGLSFQMLAGDTIYVRVYSVIALRGCRSDDGERPGLSHGGPGALGNGVGVLAIPRLAYDPLSPTIPYAPGAYDALVYPTLAAQAWPVLKRFLWATNVETGPGGKESRQTPWTASLMEWELTYDGLRSGAILGTTYAELEQLLGFYAARRGALEPFLFDDVTDNTVQDQALGTGDGTTVTFPLVRALDGGLSPIGRVNTVIDVQLDGVPTAAYTIAGNVLTFDVAPDPAAVITWSGSYYWLVRFLDPEVDFSNLMQRIWEAKRVRLRQVRQ